jgi:5'-3' exonuclease
MSLQAAVHLQPRPSVLLASSDSDMQQLMDSHTCWLELLQVWQLV